MSNFFSKVIEFNTNVLNIEQRPLAMLPENEFEISMKCLQEEVDEFEEAYKNGDFIKCIDAMIDLQYFSIGVLYKMGLKAETIDKCASAVHDANMQKKLGVNAKRAVDGAADAVKPEGWLPPEERIEAILDEQLNESDDA